MKQEDIICEADLTNENVIELAGKVIQRYQERGDDAGAVAAVFWTKVIYLLSQNNLAVPKLLTVEQVGDILQVDSETVRRYVRNGDLSALKLGNKYIRIDPADLVKFIKNLKGGGHMAYDITKEQRLLTDIDLFKKINTGEEINLEAGNAFFKKDIQYFYDNVKVKIRDGNFIKLAELFQAASTGNEETKAEFCDFYALFLKENVEFQKPFVNEVRIDNIPVSKNISSDSWSKLARLYEKEHEVKLKKAGIE